MLPNDEFIAKAHEILEKMDKHFSQQNDERFQQWDVQVPHVRLGQPQEIHGRRPGKRKMVLALRAAAQAQGKTGKHNIPSWNSMMAMDHKAVHAIGQRVFNGKFEEVLRGMPHGGAGDTPRIGEVT